MSQDPIEIILEMIKERIESNREDLKEMKEQGISQNSFGFGYSLGGLDELQYLREEIKEKFGLI